MSCGSCTGNCSSNHQTPPCSTVRSLDITDFRYDISDLKGSQALIDWVRLSVTAISNPFGFSS